MVKFQSLNIRYLRLPHSVVDKLKTSILFGPTNDITVPGGIDEDVLSNPTNKGELMILTIV